MKYLNTPIVEYLRIYHATNDPKINRTIRFFYKRYLWKTHKADYSVWFLCRRDFHSDSDIDIMVLVDLPDTQIEIYSDNLSELGFEYNVKHGIWFMPIVKNVKHFGQWCSVYPFYSNEIKEGLILYETGTMPVPNPLLPYRSAFSTNAFANAGFDG